MLKRLPKRAGIKIKHDILCVLANNKPRSISYLERKVKSDWNTIKKHCEELEAFEAVKFEDSKVKITDKGHKIKLFKASRESKRK